MGKKVSRRVVICVIILAGLAGYAGSAANETPQKRLEDLIKEGRVGEAEVILKKQIKEKKDDYAATMMLGDIYRKAGGRKKALKYYKDAVGINPDYPEAHFFLGKMYFLMQDSDRSISEFNEFKNRMKALPQMSVKAENFYIDALHYISEVYFTLKRYGDAKKEIEEVLRIDPNNQAAIYNMGVYYYYSERNRSKAYEYFKKTIELDKDARIAKKAEYAIEFMRKNSDPRFVPDFSFLDEEE